MKRYNESKEICPLFLGGCCPVNDDEWVDMGISYEEGQRINKECCETHYAPSYEELYGNKCD